jgi:predicted ABC-type sugar transport system permease subunit
MQRLRGVAPGLAVGLLVIDLVGMLVLSVVTPSFLSTYNLFVTGRDLSILLLVALAQMVVLSLGQMNLSIGSIGGLVAIIESGLMVRYGWPVPFALGAGLLLGIVCGIINGLLVHWTKINSFVLTLATSYIFAGINLGITHATPFYHIPVEISSFGQARIGAFPVMAAVTIVLTVGLFSCTRSSSAGSCWPWVATSWQRGFQGSRCGELSSRLMRSPDSSPRWPAPCSWRSWDRDSRRSARPGCCPPSPGRSSAAPPSQAEARRSSAPCWRWS